MSEFWLIGKYGKLRSYGRTLRGWVVDEKGKKREYIIPAKTLKTLVIAGRIEISEDARRLIAQNAALISLRYYGLKVAYYVQPMNVRRTSIGVQIRARTNRRLSVAKRIELDLVEALESHCERLGLSVDMQDLRLAIREAEDIHELLGYESEAWGRYYKAIATILKGFRRGKSTRFPPKDEYNAIISLSHGVLYSLILVEIISKGLLPQLGFIHEGQSISLALDIAEPLKTISFEFLLSKPKFRFREIRRGKTKGVYVDDLRKFYEAFREFLMNRKHRTSGIRLRDHIKRYTIAVLRSLGDRREAHPHGLRRRGEDRGQNVQDR